MRVGRGERKEGDALPAMSSGAVCRLMAGVCGAVGTVGAAHALADAARRSDRVRKESR